MSGILRPTRHAAFFSLSLRTYRRTCLMEGHASQRYASLLPIQPFPYACYQRFANPSDLHSMTLLDTRPIKGKSHWFLDYRPNLQIPRGGGADGSIITFSSIEL